MDIIQATVPEWFDAAQSLGMYSGALGDGGYVRTAEQLDHAAVGFVSVVRRAVNAARLAEQAEEPDVRKFAVATAMSHAAFSWDFCSCSFVADGFLKDMEELLSSFMEMDKDGTEGVNRSEMNEVMKIPKLIRLGEGGPQSQENTGGRWPRVPMELNGTA